MRGRLQLREASRKFRVSLGGERRQHKTVIKKKKGVPYIHSKGLEQVKIRRDESLGQKSWKRPSGEIGLDGRRKGRNGCERDIHLLRFVVGK